MFGYIQSYTLGNIASKIDELIISNYRVLEMEKYNKDLKLLIAAI